MSEGFTCLRCGQCCQHVGRFFWVWGNLRTKPFGIHVLLNRLAMARADLIDLEDNGPCEMLKSHCGDMICAIEKWAGRQYKPTVCRAYPEDEADCFCSETYEAGTNQCM